MIGYNKERDYMRCKKKRNITFNCVNLKINGSMIVENVTTVMTPLSTRGTTYHVLNPLTP